MIDEQASLETRSHTSSEKIPCYTYQPRDLSGSQALVRGNQDHVLDFATSLSLERSKTGYIVFFFNKKKRKVPSLKYIH